ncbi:TetR/AcrR family transcriptional regulator [Streptomyces fulvoviolaceus]|uniref:TetR/AcrR family transcriptional regulator n=1 Tax=Streptomyces fulvoviolaceus TaxID=285535 RepID=UPI0004CB8B67|nr:TetR/AcrR family transcriptional regulator [Streptomyces fulvoviolaceus]MCT9081411.1 TetR/AcrR family transcriptional regulator [Streptomyces fulvoviolaceus]
MTPARSLSLPDGPQLGLRERKKIKTRTAIRDATYALIKEQGYDATTIEQIAERAEVSPSTVFRYFPTKEDIVLTDEYDPIILAELRNRPADEPWVESVQYVMKKAISFGLEQEPEITRLRSHLLVQVPAVRARMREHISVTSRMLAEAVAERTGWDKDSLEVRVYTISLISGFGEISQYWAESDFQEDLVDLVDRTVAVLAHGLPTRKP